jgi:ABC-2 type transport system permease protein
MHVLRAYPTLLRAYWARAIEYRVTVLMWVLTSGYPVAMMGVWVAIAQRNGGSVGGYDASAFVGYYMGAIWIRRITYVWILSDLEEDIRSGTLSPYLLRPLHYMHHTFSNIIAVRFLNALIAGAIVATVVLLTPGKQFDLSPINMLLMSMAIAVGFVFEFLLQALVGCLAFWTTQVMRIFDTVWFVKSFLGGFVVPLSMLPAGVRDVARWLPFGISMGVPLEILIGRMAPADALYNIAQGLLWVGLLLLALRFAWGRGIRSYSAVGA